MTHAKGSTLTNDAQVLLDRTRSAAKKAGSHVVPAPLDISKAACPVVVMEADEMLRFVAAMRPSIIYVSATDMDVDDELATAAKTLGLEPGDRAFVDISRAGRRLARHQGAPARASIESVADGVLHLAYAGGPLD